MSTILPKWYTRTYYNEDGTRKESSTGTQWKLDVIDPEKQLVVIRYPGGRQDIKWSSDCKFCVSMKDSDFYPKHENSNPRCGGGGRGHCTCPVCWG